MTDGLLVEGGVGELPRSTSDFSPLKRQYIRKNVRFPLLQKIVSPISVLCLQTTSDFIFIISFLSLYKYYNIFFKKNQG